MVNIICDIFWRLCFYIIKKVKYLIRVFFFLFIFSIDYGCGVYVFIVVVMVGVGGLINYWDGYLF